MDTKRVKARGTRAEVWAGKARQTTGGLTRENLKVNSAGKIVSVKQSEAASRRYPNLREKLDEDPAVTAGRAKAAAELAAMRRETTCEQETDNDDYATAVFEMSPDDYFEETGLEHPYADLYHLPGRAFATRFKKLDSEAKATIVATIDATCDIVTDCNKWTDLVRGYMLLSPKCRIMVNELVEYFEKGPERA